MDKIVNKFLFEENKFIPEMHLRQLGFTLSACWSIPKNKGKIQF